MLRLILLENCRGDGQIADSQEVIAEVAIATTGGGTKKIIYGIS